MSGDEFLIEIICIALAAIVWIRHYRFILGQRTVMGAGPRWFALLLFPLLCMAGLFIVLLTLSSFDVRVSPIYMGFYLVMGAAWLTPAGGIFSFLGLNWKDDAATNGNPAALAVFLSGMAGMTAVFAGANIGNGPGWWCVVFAGGLGLVAWIGLWLLIQLIANVTEQVTVERDIYCGVRLGAFLVVSGIVCGRGAAGDWTSFEATVGEFLIVWPLIIPALVTAVLELILSRTNFFLSRKALEVGVTAAHAVFLAAFAILFFLYAGPPPVNSLYGA
jgi:hypothetical protein